MSGPRCLQFIPLVPEACGGDWGPLLPRGASWVGYMLRVLAWLLVRGLTSSCKLWRLLSNARTPGLCCGASRCPLQAPFTSKSRSRVPLLTGPSGLCRPSVFFSRADSRRLRRPRRVFEPPRVGPGVGFLPGFATVLSFFWVGMHFLAWTTYEGLLFLHGRSIGCTALLLPWQVHGLRSVFSPTVSIP